MKKIAIILIIIQLLSIFVVYGIDVSLNEAKILYDLKLFNGKSSTSYEPDLEGSMNRQEAMKMIVVALGWETAQESQCPFEDVSKWAKPYVAKAYEKGITIGYAEKRFGAFDSVSLDQLLTFYLRALGYETTYAYDNCEALGKQTGLVTNLSGNKENLKRYDLVKVTYNALLTSKVGQTKTLIEELVNSGKVNKEKAIEHGMIKEYLYQDQRDNGAKEITEDEFEKEVLQCDTPVLVEFYNSECDLCSKLKPIVDEAAIEMADEVKVVKIDGEKYEKIKNDYNVTSYPTLKFFNGEETDTIPPLQDKDVIVDWVRKKMN